MNSENPIAPARAGSQDAVREVLLNLRAQLSEAQPGVALLDLLKGLEEVAEHEDHGLSAWVAEVLAPVQQVLARAERRRRDTLADLVAGVAGPCVALSASGLPLAVNAAAAAHPDLSQGGISRLCSPAEFARLVARCRAPGRGAGLLVPAGRYGLLVAGWCENHQALLLTVPLWHWPEGLMAEMQDSFRLTPRETEIVTALMQGLGPEAIAGRDGRSVGTLRQQLKAVYAKMGVSGQAQVVALVAGLAASWQAVRPIAAQPGSGAELRFGMLAQQGRKIGLRRFGQPGGRPVLLIHGALFGVGDFAAERQAAVHSGLDVIAVERPGYGRSSDMSDKDGRDTAATDILTALDHAGFSRVAVIAQDIGTATAFRLARLAPQRVTSIVAAPTTPPMMAWEQTAVMPRGHRVHAWVAQKAPRLLDLVVSLGLAHVRARGASVLPDLFFPGCDFDRDVLARPAMRMGLEGAMALIAAQEARGFLRDMLVTNQDWSADCLGLDLPVVLLHGAESRTVAADAVARFSALLPNARMEMVPGAGHTLPLTHADHVFAHLERLQI